MTGIVRSAGSPEPGAGGPADAAAESSRPVRRPRIAKQSRGSLGLLATFGRWHVAVMELDTVPGPVVEVARLRAAKHHDCHT